MICKYVDKLGNNNMSQYGLEIFSNSIRKVIDHSDETLKIVNKNQLKKNIRHSYFILSQKIINDCKKPKDTSKDSSELTHLTVIFNAIETENITDILELLSNDNIDNYDKILKKILYKAAEYGRQIVIQKLLNEDIYIHSTTKNWIYSFGAVNGHYNVVKLMINNVNPFCNNNFALKNAIMKGYIDIVKLILMYHGKFCKNEIKIDTYTLEKCIKNDNIDMIKFLLKSKNKISIDLTENNYSLLKICLHENNLKIFKCFIRSGIDITFDNNYTLKYSAANGLPTFISYILNFKHIDPSIDNNLLLRYTCLYGYVNILKILLIHPSIDPFKNKFDILKNAVIGNHIDILKILLKYPNMNSEKNLNYILSIAKKNNVTTIVEYLHLLSN
jgi:hypothetical protein